MHRIDGPGYAPGNTFTEGNPSTATQATTVTSDWLNAVQEEIAAVIEGAGDTLDKPDNGQLLAAINRNARESRDRPGQAGGQQAIENGLRRGYPSEAPAPSFWRPARARG